MTMDNKPVVDVANMMNIGWHLKNARLQMFLNLVNRRLVTFTHNLSIYGHHIVPDALSRISNMTCVAKDCHAERFLDDLPAKVTCMSILLEALAFSSTMSSVIVTTTIEMADQLCLGSGPILLGSRHAWLNLQSECGDCKRFVK